MLTTVILLFVTLVTATAGQSCAPKDLTIDQRLALIIDDNDVDGDGFVDADDVIYDVSERYDTNNDGIWTERECETRYGCAYGTSQYMAIFACVDILNGIENLTISSFNQFPVLASPGIPNTTFIDMNRQRFIRFENNNCINTDLSVDQKVDLNARYNDFNNDGVVTAQDYEYDLSTNCDVDNNTQVTEEEWVTRWTCAYGDDGYYARYLWNLFFQGAPAVSINVLNGSADTSIEDFKSSGKQRYVDYAKTQSSEGQRAGPAGSLCVTAAVVMVVVATFR